MEDAPPVLNVLTDIAQNVEIKADQYCVSHPAYPELRLANSVIENLQKLPPTAQQECLGLQVRNFLHSVYFTGIRQASQTQKSISINFEVEKQLNQEPDPDFCRQLDKNNCGEGYFDPGWQVVNPSEPGKLMVHKDGLTLFIDRQQHLPIDSESAAPGDMVAVRLPHNRVERGFYVAVGNLGSHPTNLDSSESLVIIYFNLKPEGALAVMNHLTQQLNALQLPFSFKVLYNPINYRRRDVGMLTFASSQYPAVRQQLQVLYMQVKSLFNPDVPLFTKYLAPGLGLATLPAGTGKDLDFGLHRCQLLANGLMAAMQQQNEALDNRLLLLNYQFAQQNIDLRFAYRNVKQTDNYRPLSL
jgi:hypothetical protein